MLTFSIFYHIKMSRNTPVSNQYFSETAYGRYSSAYSICSIPHQFYFETHLFEKYINVHFSDKLILEQ